MTRLALLLGIACSRPSPDLCSRTAGGEGGLPRVPGAAFGCAGGEVHVRVGDGWGCACVQMKWEAPMDVHVIDEGVVECDAGREFLSQRQVRVCYGRAGLPPPPAWRVLGSDLHVNARGDGR